MNSTDRHVSLARVIPQIAVISHRVALLIKTQKETEGIKNR